MSTFEKIPHWLGLLLMLSFVAPLAAHESPARASAGRQKVSALLPLAARYDLGVADSRGRRHADWYLWREAGRIETANAAAGRNDIWERIGADDYHYRRIFHDDRRVVDYTPGEIKTRNAEPDWAKLASVVSPALLDQLKRRAGKTLFDQRAVRYTGRLEGQNIDLWWLEKAGLPARLQLIRGHQRMTLVLRELHDRAPAAWPRTSEKGIADYGLIDAADFGDMESDPFVARVLQQDGHAHSH